MKFNIRGQRKKYPRLEEFLVNEGFKFSNDNSTNEELVYKRGNEVVSLRIDFVVYEGDPNETGFLHPRKNVLLLDENTLSYSLIQKLAQILTPCTFPPMTNSIRIEVPDSLKQYQESE
ncbi:hypothetical protein GOV12_00530 [Candidatus Pacearchaeota archaeon]|nr:hypothetical protein [Candidatus Pacearchaeota archaeon]